MEPGTLTPAAEAKTRRGLEGRALAGFWKGGRIYGYRTEAEPNPPDPEYPRTDVKERREPMETASHRVPRGGTDKPGATVLPIVAGAVNCARWERAG